MLQGLSKDNVIFALDIGTRTVAGLVGYMEGESFRIVAQTMLEHEGRFMYDGQIHDIPRVASVVARVKSELEKTTGLTLEKVAVAAAGRSLKTVHCRVEVEQDPDKEIENLDIHGLEMAALRQAKKELENEQGYSSSENYYCVGYCVIRYMLDDLPVSNLQGHRGKTIAAEVLATFLPGSVVNSLYTVLHRVNLEPVNLTLEPIAAIDVAIPHSFRLLNLAMVDIGAGTSDIAVTRDGSIVAYGMVPIAGDEITEPIMEKLLVEFSEAEKIKRQLEQNSEITYTDILGINHTITREELVPIIEPVLDKLADSISSNILKLNGDVPPKSVFCIGGGSRIPTLTNRLAERLGLDSQRVAVRDRSMLRNVTCPENDTLSGPEGVTVVGIATVALAKLGYEFMTVKINGNEYKLFNTKNINVSHVLGLTSFDPRHLIGKNGKNLKFFLNGEEKTVFGEMGKPARILVNRRQANLQTPVRDGDEIIVIKAVSGKDASAKVADFLPKRETGFSIKLNNSEINLVPRVFLNGKTADPDTPIKQGDRLEIEVPTVERVAALAGVDYSGKKVLVNGRQATSTTELSDGDTIEIFKPGNIPGGIKVNVNGEDIVLSSRAAIFVDVFNHIEIDTSRKGGTLVMKLNGARANYTDPIKEGDRIEIYWENN